MEFWRKIGASQFVLNIIEEGYRLPFVCVLKPLIIQNNKSAEKHKGFVDTAIAELLQSGRIAESISVPHVVNPLSISVKTNSKKRLIIDLRCVNKCLQKRHIKYEGCKVAMIFYMTIICSLLTLKSVTTTLILSKAIRPI